MKLQQLVIRWKFGQYGHEREQLFSTRQAITFGRNAQNTVVIDGADKKASRFHAELRLTANGLWLRNIDDNNTMYVGGKSSERLYPPGASFSVTDGFWFRLGNTYFRVEFVTHDRPMVVCSNGHVLDARLRQCPCDGLLLAGSETYVPRE
ncbi:MAG: FHA domain-containing protein [Phototrophicaceae bacterium]|jgi:predicted component of type VI protein secretion system